MRIMRLPPARTSSSLPYPTPQTRAIPDEDDLAGGGDHLETQDEVAGVAVAGSDQRPAARADPASHQRTGVRGRVVRVDEPVAGEHLVEFQHADADTDSRRSVLAIDL